MIDGPPSSGHLREPALEAALGRPRRERSSFATRVSKQARRALRLWRLYLLRLEIRLAPTEPQRLFLLTVAIGGLCGLAAVAFHFSIDFLAKPYVSTELARRVREILDRDDEKSDV